MGSFTRALTGADCAFSGLLGVVVPPTFLASFYEKAAEGQNDALAVLSTNGEMIASKMGKNLNGDAPMVSNSSGASASKRSAVAENSSSSSSAQAGD